MSSQKKRYNPLKATSAYLSEEAQTSAEKIMDEIRPALPVISEQELQNPTPIIQHLEHTQEKEDAQSAEKELLYLLDKYYNGDRDKPKELRYKNKDQYKQLLIQKFKQWGLLYIEKKHYALSRPEKHLIRIDFYGTVNKPRLDQKSEAYTQNSTVFGEELSRKGKKKAKNSPNNTSAPERSAPSPEQPQYTPQDYDLNTSPTWRLMRTFPRFHTIENKVRIQMAKQGLNPQILPYLNVYDYSDILYNYFQRPETQEGESVRIFLGARQAFIKDLFRKHADWFRDYFKRHHYDERYAEALIKSAQRKGVTANIDLKDNMHDYIIEYLHNHKQNFISFTQQALNNGQHVSGILERLQNPNAPLTEEMKSFLIENEPQFQNYLKRKYITSYLLNATFEALNDNGTPRYVTENIRMFVLSSADGFKNFILQQGLTERDYEVMKEKIKNKPPRGKLESLMTAYAKQNLEKFQHFLLSENRDENYIKFATNSLKRPLVPAYVRESLYNFIVSKDDSPLSQQLQQEGITRDNFASVKAYILQHRKEYSEFFKQNNILTIQELNEQYTDITNFIIKTQNMPSYITNFAQQFIRNNQTVFRYWYANFRVRQHQIDAEKKHKNIMENGLSETDFKEVSTFIKERLDIFSEYCQGKGLALTSAEIQAIFNQGNFLNPQELNKFSNKESVSLMRDFVEQFIRRNGYIYRNSLVQQHIQAKENEADIILKKLTQQGITSNTMAIAHKFILNNKPLFNNDLYNSADAKNYSQDIISKLMNNTANKDIVQISKNFILHRPKEFSGFIREPKNIENYIANITQELESAQHKGDVSYWGLQYISQNQADFLQYLENEKIGPENIETFKQQLSSDLSQDLKMTYEKGNAVLQFNDGAIVKIIIAVHHIKAVQDSIEEDIPTLTDTNKKPLKPDSTYIPNLAAANYFKNLSAVIDDPYHIRFFHGMDKTEKFDNWERYIGRIYPQNPHLVFFGGLDPQDQLSYDYTQDERTKRYQRHTEKMMQLNEEQRQHDDLSPEMRFFIVTGSRQGR